MYEDQQLSSPVSWNLWPGLGDLSAATAQSHPADGEPELPPGK